jgi:hypothetical protein
VDAVDVVPSFVAAPVESINEPYAELVGVAPIEVVEESRDATGASSSFDEMRPRVHVGLIHVGRSYSQSNDDVTDDVPSKASFTEPLPIGAIGLRASGEMAIGRVLGEIDLYLAAHSIDLGTEVELNYVYSLTAGAVVQGPWKGGFMWEAGGWLHRGDGLLMSYNSGQTALVQKSNAFNGLRVGGGIVGSLGPLSTRFRIAETFAPLPVATHISARTEMVIPELEIWNKPVWGAVDASLDLLHGFGDVGGVRAFVFERRIAVTFMVGIDL